MWIDRLDEHFIKKFSLCYITTCIVSDPYEKPSNFNFHTLLVGDSLEGGHLYIELGSTENHVFSHTRFVHESLYIHYNYVYVDKCNHVFSFFFLLFNIYIFAHIYK